MLGERSTISLSRKQKTCSRTDNGLALLLLPSSNIWGCSGRRSLPSPNVLSKFLWKFLMNEPKSSTCSIQSPQMIRACSSLIPGHGQTIPRSVSHTCQHHLNVARKPSWLFLLGCLASATGGKDMRSAFIDLCRTIALLL